MNKFHSFVITTITLNLLGPIS